MKYQEITNLRSDLNSDPYIGRIVEFLLHYYEPRKIYLFGSRAKGTNRPDSDYDIAVEMDETSSNLSVNRYDWGLTEFPIDFVCMKKIDPELSAVAKEILDFGVILYERAK